LNTDEYINQINDFYKKIKQKKVVDSVAVMADVQTPQEAQPMEQVEIVENLKENQNIPIDEIPRIEVQPKDEPTLPVNPPLYVPPALNGYPPEATLFEGIEPFDEFSSLFLGADRGFFQAYTFLGQGAFPVADTIIEISKVINGVVRKIATLVTDETGKTPVFALPAPSKVFSTSPNFYGKPFSTYIIDIKKEGYFDIKSYDVEVFSGEVSVPQIVMLPLPEFGAKQSYEIKNTKHKLEQGG
jgi:hypothetical protein